MFLPAIFEIILIEKSLNNEFSDPFLSNIWILLCFDSFGMKPSKHAAMPCAHTPFCSMGSLNMAAMGPGKSWNLKCPGKSSGMLKFLKNQDFLIFHLVEDFSRFFILTSGVKWCYKCHFKGLLDKSEYSGCFAAQDLRLLWTRLFVIGICIYIKFMYLFLFDKR